MTQSYFIVVCLEHEIDPPIALECEAVRKALKKAKQTGNDDLVIKAIEDNF